MNEKYLFVVCQKIAVFRNNDTEVLLAKRSGEEDFDSTYAYIVGKMEMGDNGIVGSLRREKNEEIGEQAKISVYPLVSYNVHFVKKNGHHVILPHYYARYESGEILLGEEYSDYKWVKVKDLSSFKPMIENIVEISDRLLEIKATARVSDFVSI